MANDKKLDIEDIKDPLEEAVNEDEAEELEDEVSTPAPEEADKDVLEKLVPSITEGAVEESKVTPQKVEKPKKDRKWLKTVLLILLTSLVTAAIVLGGVFLFLGQNQKKAETNTPEVKTEAPKTEAKTSASKTIYVNAKEGLRLRKTADANGEILDTMSFGTKLTATETSGEWSKVEYNGKTGWCLTSYTQTTDPMVYKNTDYGFEITFPVGYESYILDPIKADSTDTAAWYVSLATTSAATETGVTKGYASMFALTLYTKAQWAAAQAQEGPKPTFAAQNDKYVIAYSLPNGIPPADLKTQRDAAKSVVATIKFE